MINNNKYMNTQDRLPPYEISNYATSPRTMSFKSWLASPVTDIDGPRKFDNGDTYTHNDFVLNYIDGLTSIICSTGYSIEDEKQFRNEIAVYVYRLSKEKL